MNEFYGTYKHKKTGRLYVVMTGALLESDRTPMVVYQSVDTSMKFVRPATEFRTNFVQYEAV